MEDTPKTPPTNRIRRFIPGVTGVLLTIALVWGLAQHSYGCDWTGFGECPIVKTSDKIDIRREKTLWDWLGLLGVPAALTAIGLFFNAADQKRAAEVAEDALLR